MIIRWNQKYFTFRYLPMEQQKAVSLFFQGGNVGYRRSVFSEVGDFDIKMRACEDVDMGIRFSERGSLFSYPSAQVRHTANFTFKKIIQQWWLTACYQVILMRKISKGGIEIFSSTGARDPEATDHQCWVARPCPVTIIIFLSSLLSMNIGILLMIGASLMGWVPIFYIGLLSTAVSATIYLVPDFRRKDLSLMRRLRFCFIRFIINQMLLWISFVQGLRLRMIYVSHVYSAV
ncbi:MAG: glycosyltransferase family 2 protein [Pirellulaceae bacterium]|nr:glycosyltransferase family 2 protein [Pirellulaceae bacterium]